MLPECITVSLLQFQLYKKLILKKYSIFHCFFLFIWQSYKFNLYIYIYLFIKNKKNILLFRLDTFFSKIEYYVKKTCNKLVKKIEKIQLVKQKHYNKFFVLIWINNNFNMNLYKIQVHIKIIILLFSKLKLLFHITAQKINIIYTAFIQKNQISNKIKAI